jgi:hypothetical protein
MLKNSIVLLLVVIFCSGCGLRAREEELKKKETVLAEKEQQLLLKEKELGAREEQLMQIEKHIDSVRVGVDTSRRYNEELIGLWSVKMTCTETSCSGSAVGDTKTENWDVSYQDNTIIAKAMNGTELIRTYTGSLTNSTISLTDDVPASESGPATHMQIRLTWADGKSMDGQREIVRQNDCRLVYRLQMTKQ